MHPLLLLTLTTSTTITLAGSGSGHYILFLDTAKAFDSVDHGYIIKVLGKLGLPQWVINFVQGILHDVRVFPILAEDTGIFIHIRRGVKQGCPLSPLLFAICFDPLLFSLSRIQDSEPCAFADDLAFSADDLASIIEALGIIKKFSRESGLGLNISKTHILTTIPPSAREVDRKNFHGWRKIKFVDQTTYLGVLLGRTITTELIFKKAFDKFKDRLRVYGPAIKAASLHKRIIIFNVYLNTLFSYLAQLYLIPPKILTQVKELSRKSIIPFHGGGFGYAHLVTPARSFGPHAPLRDPWAANMAALICNFPYDLLQQCHQAYTPAPLIEAYPGVNKTNDWGDLTVTDHAAAATYSYLEYFNPGDHHDRIDLSHLKGIIKKDRARLYRDLVIEGYRVARTYPKDAGSLANKLTRMGAVSPLASMHCTANAHMHAHKFKAHVWNVQLRFTMNALPTDKRRSQAKMEVIGRASPHSDSPFPCHLCGAGEDSTAHFWTDCKVVADVIAAVGAAAQTSIKQELNHGLLVFDPKCITNDPRPRHHRP